MLMSASSMTPSGPWAAALALLRGGAGGTANGGFEDMFGGLFTGNAGRHAGGFSTAGGIPPEFADLFGGGFGGQTGFQRAPQKGADRTASTSISFAGSIRGTTIGLREPGRRSHRRPRAGRHQGRPEGARPRQGPVRSRQATAT